MGEGISTEFKMEGQPAFPSTDGGNDNPSGSSPENTDGNQDPSSGGSGENQTPKDGADAGFADHPRWKEREQDWTNRYNEQEKRHSEELAQLRQDMEEKLKGIGPKSEQDGEGMDPEDWFGGDAKSWAKFNAWHEERMQKAMEKFKSELSNEAGESQKRLDEATTYFESEVKAIEADKGLNPNGAKVDRNKLLKCAMDNDLVDSKTRWNYRAAWRILQASEPSKKTDTTERKGFAAATTSDNRTDGKTPKVTSSQTFKDPSNRPW